MGGTTIDHARDLFRAVASIYSACFDDDDGGAVAILSSLANDEYVQKFVKCTYLAKIEAMSDHMRKIMQALWADPEGPHKNMKAILKGYGTISGRNNTSNSRLESNIPPHERSPQGYAENKKLAAWVITQRTQYKLFKASKKSCI